MQISQGKVFEKAQGGTYIGTIIDVVEMPATKLPNGQVAVKVINGQAVPEKDRVRIQWALAYENNAAYLDKDGVTMTIAGFYSAVLAPKSKLFKALFGVLQGQVPLITSTEQLESLLLGRSNRLLITQEPNPQNPNDFYSNIVGILPLNPGQNPVAAPQGFQRSKFRTKQTAGPQPGQTTPTYAQPPQQPPATPPANTRNLASNPDAF